MKQIAIIISAALLVLPTVLFAEVSERVWVSTDKDVYLSGETVWCSVFSIDATTGSLSHENSVAYLEMSSVSGTLVTCKIAMVGGRGSGAFQIPVSAHTGNYTLVGYTASSRGRSDVHADARLLSVFNTSSGLRVKGGVDIVDPSAYAALAAKDNMASGPLSIGVESSVPRSSAVTLNIGNSLPSGASLSLSVHCDDGIIAPDGKSIVDFVGTPFAPFQGSAEDKEGETLHGRLFGADASTVTQDLDLLAVVAFPGYAEDVYAGKISADGTASFRTGNIYGDRDMVCEIVGLDDSRECRLVIESPFLGVKVPSFPSLKLSEASKDALEKRMKSLLTPGRYSLDTLAEFLPKRGSIFLADDLCKRYHLDDYRRFPTIRETLVEITPDLRIRKDIKGRPQIQTVLEGVVRDNLEFSGNMLVLIDGVPVKDVEKLLEFDAMLVGDILIYPYNYSLGNAIFNGVVDFVTKTGDISSFKFDRNVVIVDWQGEAYPVAFTCPNLPEGGEDFRNTLYWHPQIDLKAGENTSVQVRTPSYPGRFKIVAEGISADGKPLRSEASFEVR